jgi:tetratricopeptide (TPR) repeat protein
MKPCGSTDNAVAYYNRGLTYFDMDQTDRAIADFDEALRLDPGLAAAYNGRGAVYNYEGQYDRAIADFDEALGLAPGYGWAYGNRCLAYGHKGQYDRAIGDYDEALRLYPPGAADIYDSLARLRATSRDARFRDGALAVQLAQKAVALRASDPKYLDTLAAAYGEAGRFAEAVKTQQDAIAMLRAQGRGDDVVDYQKRLAAYQQGRAWRE